MTGSRTSSRASAASTSSTRRRPTASRRSSSSSSSRRTSTRRRRTFATRSPPCARSCPRRSSSRSSSGSIRTRCRSSRSRSRRLTLTPPQLTQIADQTIGGELRSIPGVAQVNVVGADSAQLNVDVDPARLAAAGVGIDQVVNALRAQNLAAPVGQVTTDRRAAHHPSRGPARAPGGLRAARRHAAQRRSSSDSARSPTSRPASAEPTSAALFNGRAGDRSRHREVAASTARRR